MSDERSTWPLVCTQLLTEEVENILGFPPVPPPPARGPPAKGADAKEGCKT